MLLPREKKMIELIYRSKNGLTTFELANALNISQRTVKYELQKIKEELKSSGCRIDSKTGRGIWISCSEEGKKFLDNLLLNEEAPCSFIPEVRKYYIALKLLDSDDFISMESISQTMFVSNGTIMNDMNKLETFFQKQGLELERKVKYGVRVRGTEELIRVAKANVIRSIIASQGNDVSLKLQPFFDDIDLSSLNGILQESEEKFSFVLTDASYSEMLLHLAIIIKRLMKKKNCMIDEENLLEYRKKEEWETCCFLGERVQEVFGVEVSNGDIVYICMNLSAAKLLREALVFSHESEQAGEVPSQTFEAWERIVGSVGEMYGENLLDDNMFKTALFVHLNAMFNRLRNKIYIENPLKDMVKEELAYEFDVATYMAGLFYAEYGIKLGENEICDIALYIGASLQREQAQRKVEQPRVMIVCSTGVGTSQFVVTKLKLYFPDMIITKIVPATRAEAVARQETLDFVISTVPLKLEGVNVIPVSPLLTEHDINKIKMAIHVSPAEPVRRGNEKYATLFKLMDGRISILKCDCRSKEEAIRLLGGRLHQEGYVDEEFVDSVFMRENLAATSIGCTFAIPHAYEGHIKKQGIGLMTLKHPILWGGEEKVQIIMMLSIDVKLNESFKVIFGELADLTKDMTAVDRILKADRFSDISRFFQ